METPESHTSSQAVISKIERVNLNFTVQKCAKPHMLFRKMF